MKRREIPAVVVAILVGCGIELETAPADSDGDAGTDARTGTVHDPEDVESACQPLLLTGAFCPTDDVSSDVRCVRAENAGEQVRLPVSSIAGAHVGGCTDPFQVRAGHVQIRRPLPKTFRVGAKVRFAANQAGMFVLGLGGDPPGQLSSGTCGSLTAGDSVVAFWGQCDDAGMCAWKLTAGTQGDCNIPDVPPVNALPTPTTLEVSMRFDGEALYATLTTTPDGGLATTVAMPVPSTAFATSSHAALMYYAYDDKLESERSVYVETIEQTCSAADDAE